VSTAIQFYDPISSRLQISCHAYFWRIKCSLANPNYSFEIVTSSFIGNSTKVIPYESNAVADPFISSFDPSLPIDHELLHPNRFRELSHHNDYQFYTL
jgi:hypothetical protein